MLRGLPCKSAGLTMERAQRRPPAALLLAAPGPAQQLARGQLRSRRLHE